MFGFVLRWQYTPCLHASLGFSQGELWNDFRGFGRCPLNALNSGWTLITIYFTALLYITLM